jgi:thiosulfate reductase cytochrome b subunit
MGGSVMVPTVLISPFPESAEMETSVARWSINVVAFVLFVLMLITGVAAWLLPHGGGPTSAVYGLRQGLRTVHQVGALLFFLTIGIHLLLHGRYIRQNLKKSGLLKDR